MLQEAIDKNRKFLKVCGITAAVFAVVNVVASLLNAASMVGNLRWVFFSMGGFVAMLLSVCNTFASLLVAVMFLALGEFIWWALDRSHKAGPVLQHVDKAIYAYVGVRMFFRCVGGLTMVLQGNPMQGAFWRAGLYYSWTAIWEAVTLVPWVLLGIAVGKGARLILESQKATPEAASVGA
jgi:hypothetical protein